MIFSAQLYHKLDEPYAWLYTLNSFIQNNHPFFVWMITFHCVSFKFLWLSLKTQSFLVVCSVLPTAVTVNFLSSKKDWWTQEDSNKPFLTIHKTINRLNVTCCHKKCFYVIFVCLIKSDSSFATLPSGKWVLFVGCTLNLYVKVHLTLHLHLTFRITSSYIYYQYTK